MIVLSKKRSIIVHQLVDNDNDGFISNTNILDESAIINNSIDTTNKSAVHVSTKDTPGGGRSVSFSDIANVFPPVTTDGPPIHSNNKYHNDAAYRERTLQRFKDKQAQKDALLLPNMKKPRGRPPVAILDDNLNLVSVH